MVKAPADLGVDVRKDAHEEAATLQRRSAELSLKCQLLAELSNEIRQHAHSLIAETRFLKDARAAAKQPAPTE